MRRALDADRATASGAGPTAISCSPIQNSELGYAVTDHTAQGRTVHTGLAVITGTEDRQHAYVALTRGTNVNTAYVFTLSPKLADPVPGPRPAPELARYDRLTPPGGQPATSPTEGRSQSWPAYWSTTASSTPRPRPGTRPCRTPTTWPCCTRSGPPRPPPPATSATATCSLAALPPGYRAEPSHQAKWLWHTLRAAELAGLDPGEVLADAIAERDLAGARDIPAVLDARLRRRIGSLSRSRPARGPPRSPPSPTPNAAPTPRRSPR